MSGKYVCQQRQILFHSRKIWQYTHTHLNQLNFLEIGKTSNKIEKRNLGEFGIQIDKVSKFQSQKLSYKSLKLVHLSRLRNNFIININRAARKIRNVTILRILLCNDISALYSTFSLRNFV